jgi:hypothetical protein
MCGLEAAIAGTTVPQKKEPGHLSNPSKPSYSHRFCKTPSASDNPWIKLRHLLAACVPLINLDIAYLQRCPDGRRQSYRTGDG